jgi:hypothetical protein
MYYTHTHTHTHNVLRQNPSEQWTGTETMKDKKAKQVMLKPGKMGEGG